LKVAEAERTLDRGFIKCSLMKAMVVFVHPQPDDFTNGLRDATVAALRDKGHEVVTVEPYREGFEAAMSAEELSAYSTQSESQIADPIARRYADLVAEATSIAFVFPMWWSGPPSMLKGFFDRVLVGGVAFRMDDNGRIRPGLQHVRNVFIVTAAEPPGHFPHRSVRHLATRFAKSLRRATGRKTKTTVEWAGPGIRGDATAEAHFIVQVGRQITRRSTGGAR